MSDESKAAEKVSGKAAEKPAEEQVSEPEAVGEPAAGAEEPVKPVVEDKPAESLAEVADDEDEFSIAGSLPEPRTKTLAILAAGVLALDVLTKVVSVAFLEDSEPIKLFGGVLYLTFVRNPGAAFGLAEGMTWILALIALGVAGFIFWISRNLRSQGWAVGLGLVLGGAVGNLADRLFREPGPMRGHVVDFLSLFDPFGRVWPVFNVADMAIVCGGATIIVLALRQHDYDGTVHKDAAPVPVEPDGLPEPK
ncbi:signal peptidase II [Lentzea sp. BCCO 10_0856]|uniref:Lipoprotein signal peptidase n=1 Tax=Lentzea miocenica TaxID=3095431 RepID=A0ABU4T918_9PSEU|nr:signal peptidase II [Lentzea sp. BCCO 10_0856]MDX8034418.1 signal peptidase II [Lentzea sp. BCCO 10_0856]